MGLSWDLEMGHCPGVSVIILDRGRGLRAGADVRMVRRSVVWPSVVGESWTGQGTGSPRASRRQQPCPHLDSGLLALELPNDKPVLF
jgi:hypothetical protein